MTAFHGEGAPIPGLVLRHLLEMVGSSICSWEGPESVNLGAMGTRWEEKEDRFLGRPGVQKAEGTGSPLSAEAKVQWLNPPDHPLLLSCPTHYS